MLEKAISNASSLVAEQMHVEPSTDVTSYKGNVKVFKTIDQSKQNSWYHKTFRRTKRGRK